MDYGPYMARIEAALGTIRAADRIDEGPWSTTVPQVLDNMARDCAAELQAETGVQHIKPGYKLDLREAPPTRLLFFVLPLAAWLGWIMREKQGDDPQRVFSSTDCLRRIQEAFEYGVDLSKRGGRP